MILGLVRELTELGMDFKCVRGWVRVRGRRGVGDVGEVRGVCDMRGT